MPSRISEILTTLSSGEDGGKSIYDIFAEIFEGLDQRLAVIENVSSSLAALQEQLATSSQSIVDAALDPVLASIETKADLGAILTASSVSEVSIDTGLKTFVIAPAEAWRMFAPAHILSISVTDNPLVCIYARRVSYDAGTGTLVVDVLATFGTGTYSGWTIAPGSLATMASALTVAPAGAEITGPTLQAALAQIADALSARQPGAAILSALSALDVAGNRVLATGADGAWQQVAITTFGRALLGVINADDLRTGIGAAPLLSPALEGSPTAPTAAVSEDSNQVANVTAVRSAITAREQASVLDTTAGKFLKAGSFGLGGLVPQLNSTHNLNDLKDVTGFYQWGSDLPINAPLTFCGLINIRRNASTGMQIVFPFNDNPIRWRFDSAGSWSSWKILPRETLGTVAQSGGVPSGAIFERGSNANGEYVRFADGTQICTHYVDMSGMAMTVAAGSLFVSSLQSWTFPAAFVATPRFSSNAQRSNDAMVTGISCRNQNSTSLQWLQWTSASSPVDSGGKAAHLVAIGRWF